MTTPGVLLLSHVGFSFLDDLIALLDARGLRSYVLSSLPLPEHRPQRLADLESRVTRLFSTPSHVLTQADVDRTLTVLQASRQPVLCCITVWEAYRGLMAHANQRLGAPDLSVATIEALRDKLTLRNSLTAAGLSSVTATVLTPASLDRLKADGRRYFIKPRCGIASYGAFPMRADTQWAAIERIVAEAAKDVVYRSAFNGELLFLAEDYLPGREFSFETIIVGGRVHVVAIHEKCEVTKAAGTVLENSCTSPPHSIGEAECAAGIAWIGRVMAHLDLAWGCFHVEARFDGERWDLIEINPRVGGSLISHSVMALNGEWSMLALWLESLLAAVDPDRERKRSFDERLQVLSFSEAGRPPTEAATFFRVYFAEVGRIEYVGPREISRAPVVSQILLKSGDEVASSSREVFLGQMLWQLSRDERDAGLAALARDSEHAIEIRYSTIPA